MYFLFLQGWDCVVVFSHSDIRADMAEAEQLLDALRVMFSDSNPVVVANAVAALSEISDAAPNNLLQQYMGTQQKQRGKTPITPLYNVRYSDLIIYILYITQIL